MYEDGEAKLAEGYEVLTEFDFLVRFCKDAVCDQIAKEVKKVGEFDGVSRIFYPTKTQADIALYVGDDDNLSIHIGDGWGNINQITDKDFARILGELYNLDLITPLLYKK